LEILFHHGVAAAAVGGEGKTTEELLPDVSVAAVALNLFSLDTVVVAVVVKA